MWTQVIPTLPLESPGCDFSVIGGGLGYALTDDQSPILSSSFPGKPDPTQTGSLPSGRSNSLDLQRSWNVVCWLA
jgi:hypothetical protein